MPRRLQEQGLRSSPQQDQDWWPRPYNISVIIGTTSTSKPTRYLLQSSTRPRLPSQLRPRLTPRTHEPTRSAPKSSTRSRPANLCPNLTGVVCAKIKISAQGSPTSVQPTPRGAVYAQRHQLQGPSSLTPRLSSPPRSRAPPRTPTAPRDILATEHRQDQPKAKTSRTPSTPPDPGRGVQQPQGEGF